MGKECFYRRQAQQFFTSLVPPDSALLLRRLFMDDPRAVYENQLFDFPLQHAPAHQPDQSASSMGMPRQDHLPIFRSRHMVDERLGKSAVVLQTPGFFRLLAAAETRGVRGRHPVLRSQSVNDGPKQFLVGSPAMEQYHQRPLPLLYVLDLQAPICHLHKVLLYH